MMGPWGWADQESHREELHQGACSLKGFSRKEIFVSEALVSEDLNESLDPAVSLATPWTLAASSLTRECSRAGPLRLRAEYRWPREPPKMLILIQWVRLPDKLPGDADQAGPLATL